MTIKFEKNVDLQGIAWYNVWVGDTRKIHTKDQAEAKKVYSSLTNISLGLKKIAVNTLVVGFALLIIWMLTLFITAIALGFPKNFPNWLNLMGVGTVLILFGGAILLGYTYKNILIEEYKNLLK